MRNLKMELVNRFGMDGAGELAETKWLGRDNNSKVTVEEFEAWSGAKLTNRKANEYGTEDCKVNLIDEKDEDFEMTVEIKDEVITHCYY